MGFDRSKLTSAVEALVIAGEAADATRAFTSDAAPKKRSNGNRAKASSACIACIERASDLIRAFLQENPPDEKPPTAPAGETKA